MQVQSCEHSRIAALSSAFDPQISIQQHASFAELISLHKLHWLSLPESIKCQLAVMVFRCCHNITPKYLAKKLQWAAKSISARHLVWQFWGPNFTVSVSAFGAATANTSNSPPPTVTFAVKINSFKNHLKNHLFHCSFSSSTTTVLRPFVQDYPGEPVPEETLTHPPSWSSNQDGGWVGWWVGEFLPFIVTLNSDYSF